MMAEPLARRALDGQPAGRQRGARLVRPVLAWWRRRSLRARLTLLSTLVLAVGLAAGGLLLAQTLEDSLVAALHDSASARAAEVAGVVDRGERLPAVLASSPDDAVRVQVLDAAGQVRAASVFAGSRSALLDGERLQAALGGRPRLLVDRQEGPPLLAVARLAGPAEDRLTVVAAVSVTQVQGSVYVVARGLLVGVPLLVLLGAAAVWVLTGFTLRPVAALRRGAQAMTGTDTARRLPVPPAQDEVHRLAVTLNAMLARIDAATARQRSFVGDAAHELRSPLASLRTQLEVALVYPDLADWPETGREMLEDTLRLARLVEDLLVLARVDAAVVGRTRPVDLAEVALAVVGRLTDPRVPVEVVAMSHGTVLAEPDGLARLVRNLVDNALRHATTQVWVEVREGPDGVLLTVTDDGPGIPVADRERVFERFTRLDEARASDVGGAGLGLPIVRDLAGAYGGVVQLEDACLGVRAVVVLPAAGPAQVTSPRGAAAAGQGRAGE